MAKRWKQMCRFPLMTLWNFGTGRRSIEGRVREEAQHLVRVLTQTEAEPMDPACILAGSPCNRICFILFKEHNYQDEEFLNRIGLLNENVSI